VHRISRLGPAAVVAAAVVHLLSASSSHAAGSAHAHGLAKLDVAVEAQRISIQFESPLDNLVGFERAPRTDAERRLVDAALARLNAADALFRIDPAAQCKPTKVELASAALKLGSHGAADEKSGHADIDGSFEFTCADAAKAAHIDLGLFEFKRLQRLEVQLVTPKGQFKRTLKAPAGRLLLTR
jgi:hypothetical protein